MKFLGWVLVLLLTIFAFVKGLLAVVIYPLLYPFRTKIKKAMFDNSNVAGCVFRNEPLKPKGIARLVRPLWWFFDDSVSDVGGRWFVREVCKKDVGESYDLITENAFAVTGKEPIIVNPQRRFYCAFRWSVIRNAMTNFSYDVLTVRIKSKPEVVFDNGGEGIKGYRIKTEDGLLDMYRTKLGMTVYYVNGWLPCIESAFVIGRFGIEPSVGFLSRSGRFEVSLRPQIIKG